MSIASVPDFYFIFFLLGLKCIKASVTISECKYVVGTTTPTYSIIVVVVESFMRFSNKWTFIIDGG